MKNIIIISGIFIAAAALGSGGDINIWGTPAEKAKYCREKVSVYKEYVCSKKEKAAPLELRQMAILFFEGRDGDQDLEFTEQARIYIDRFFESVEHATIPDDWRVAARIYSNAGRLSQDPKLSLTYQRKAVDFWEQYFGESDLKSIENMDYANCAVAYTNLGFDAKDFEEKEKAYEKSAIYWDQYFIKSMDRSTALRLRGDAYNNAAFWAMSPENRSKFSKKAASFWTLFLNTTPHPTLEDIANVMNAYQEVIRYENTEKQKYYLGKMKRLSATYKISHVYQLGNDIFFFVESETRALKKKTPLTLTLPPEEESPQEDLTEERPVVTKDVPAQDEPKVVKMSVEKEAKALEVSKEVPKLTKSQKRLLRMQDEIPIPEGVVKKATREHTVDPLTVMQIRKAYEKEKAKEQAMDVLEESLALESGANERTILSHISRLKKYFSVRKNDGSEKTVILGHDVPDFYFHSAHGNRQGDWDAGMIRRFKSFVRDIKITFETIIK